MAASIFDVDPRLLVIQIFAGSEMLGAVLLGHVILFRRQAGDGFGVLLYFGILIFLAHWFLRSASECPL
jgi:hypothetical protein